MNMVDFWIRSKKTNFKFNINSRRFIRVYTFCVHITPYGSQLRNYIKKEKVIVILCETKHDPEKVDIN